MNESDPLLVSHLIDYRFDRLQISCASCGRHGDYSVRTLRKLYGNPPMAEVPRFVAMRGNCPLALRFPGKDCDARFTNRAAPKSVEYLGSAYHAGWSIVLTCQRSHQGLKSVKPCREPYLIDLGSLVAALGHTFPINQLERKLCCPNCGSVHYDLRWIVPKEPPATEPVPLRKVG
jgi:hypothetical protein